MTDSPWLTTTGKDHWRPSTVRQMLRSARISGQREHNGQIVNPAAWEPIISPEQTEKIRTLLDDPSRRASRTPRRYLLKGLLRFHRCDTTMVASPREGVRRYICKNDGNIRGCGRTYVNAERVEELVYEAVLYRLDSPDLAVALAGRHRTDATTAELSDDLARVEGKLAQLAGMWADDEITVEEYRTARGKLEPRRDGLRRRLAQATQTTAIDGLVGHAGQLRGAWDGLDLTRQSRIVATLLDHAVVGPGPGGRARFDPDRISPVWRL